MNGYPEYPTTQDQLLKDFAIECGVKEWLHATVVKEYAGTLTLWQKFQPHSICLLQKFGRLYGYDITITKR